MVSKLVKGFREWYKRSSDADYAYLCQARDVVDLEWRMKRLHTRPSVSTFPLFTVR